MTWAHPSVNNLAKLYGPFLRCGQSTSSGGQSAADQLDQSRHRLVPLLHQKGPRVLHDSRTTPTNAKTPYTAHFRIELSFSKPPLHLGDDAANKPASVQKKMRFQTRAGSN